MNIYDNNKQLLSAMGGNADNYSTDFEVRKAILDALGGDSSKCYSIYEVDKQILNIYLEGGGGTGGSEKVKVFSLKVNNSCIVDGTWNCDMIDTSNVTSMDSMFKNCSSLQTLDVSGLDTSNVKDMSSVFDGCSSLQTLDVSGFDTSNVKYMSSMFNDCSSLQTLDVSGFDTSNVTSIGTMFNDCDKLTTLIGGRTIDDVLSNNISALNGLKKNISFSYTQLDRASLRAVINGLADLTGSTSGTFDLDTTLMTKLTEEDIAIATAKNWTIS
jgi:surface protein